jgi:hypothetical protein
MDVQIAMGNVCSVNVLLCAQQSKAQDSAFALKLRALGHDGSKALNLHV